MAIPILHTWPRYFDDPDEGLGSSYERIIINDLLAKICRSFPISTVLEAPAFGFTGLSGINSLALAQAGKSVTLLDHDASRTEKIADLWRSLSLDLDAQTVASYDVLPFEDNQFDLSWNFSALWFTGDVEKFLAQLTRITRRVILLCVPNRSGLGYVSQAIMGRAELKSALNEEHIKAQTFIPIMEKQGWKCIKWDFIDCPPWPDIGMPKEKFLSLFGLQWLLPTRKPTPISIMDYYRGEDPEFPDAMRTRAWLERMAPSLFKRFWAHHRYYLFIPEDPDA